MTTSTSSGTDRAFVWIWLPGAPRPVAAGALRRRGTEIEFAYGARYLERSDAISLWDQELPLREGWIRPRTSIGIASCLRDAAPDAWGRRVIVDRLYGREAVRSGMEVDELTYLLEASHDRVGGLDVQGSPTEYVAGTDDYPLDQVQDAARALDLDVTVPEELRVALDSGTGVGGACPKALTRYRDRMVLAKFSTSDTPADLPAVAAEGLALALARGAGIEVPDARVLRIGQRRALLVDRFDRPLDGGRRLLLSALTLTGLDESEARYGTYPDLLEVLRARATQPGPAGADLFRRIAFNIAITNTDDHLRNHAAFWDGKHSDLTPAYDLSPGARTGDTAYLHLAYDRDGNREARFATLVRAAHLYDLSRPAARTIVDEVVAAIRDGWKAAADEALLTRAEQHALFGRQFLHQSVWYDY